MNERNRLPSGLVSLIGGITMAALCGFLAWLGGFALIVAIIAGCAAVALFIAAAVDAS